MIFIKFTSTNEPQSMHPEEKRGGQKQRRPLTLMNRKVCTAKKDAAVADRFAKQSSEWFKGWQDLGQSPKVLGDFKYEGNKHK